jgi:hypothetical protein
MNRHDRRHSGRRYTVIYHPEKPENSLEEEKYDDWDNYRDGMRSPVDRSRIRPTKGISGWFLDHCKIIADNFKLKRKERIRRVRRAKMEVKKVSFMCKDCGSTDYPYHNEYCTMGDIGWTVKKEKK